jgi:glycosyltransferase involved in cell wall biosynthesis
MKLMNREDKILNTKDIVYVGPFSFPYGGAAARRILGVSKSMQAAGFQVKVASGQMGRAAQSPEWFEGIEVYSLSERTAEHLPRLLKHLAYLSMGGNTVAWLDSLANKPHTVILYSGYSPYLFKLLPWARRNGVRLVFDAVEWYDPASPMGWLSPYQLNIELAMRVLLPRVDRIISISDYLHRYYLGRGCESLVVPPTLDVIATPARTDGRDASRPLEVVYAGSPGRKDLLDNILEAVLRLRRCGLAVRMSVAGISAKDAERYAAVRSRPSSEVAAGVTFCGVLDHEASMDLVRQSDFSLLLRHDARYSRAGFPTKFVESFTVGTPVIANLTSDLHRYLRDGETGITCTGSEPEALEVALRRALALPRDQHASMRTRCRAIAAEAFDYHVYAESLSQFLCSAEV